MTLNDLNSIPIIGTHYGFALDVPLGSTFLAASRVRTTRRGAPQERESNNHVRKSSGAASCAVFVSAWRWSPGTLGELRGHRLGVGPLERPAQQSLLQRHCVDAVSLVARTSMGATAYSSSVVWTSLHMALGASDDRLTIDLVQQACAEHIPESASLDWKRDWPLTGAMTEQKQAKQQEFAKDIAAMANTGGGLIVYGVDETRVDDRSVAERIVSVGEVTETQMRELYQAANNLIYPAVAGLKMVLVSDPGSAQSVLAAVVPDSASRPHLIHPKGRPDWFMAPWRNGPDTMFMSERQLADEYRQRDRGRDQRDQEMEAIWSSAMKACGAVRDKQWIIGVLQPERSPLHRRPIQRSQARTVLDWCDRNQVGLSELGGDSPVSAIYVNQHRELHRGLRMFYRATPANSNVCGRVEVHADGTIVMAVHRSEGGFRERMVSLDGDVAICDIEQLGLDLAVALSATRAVFGMAGDYTLRVGVEPGTQIFRRSEQMLKGGFMPWDEADRVPNFRTVTGTIGTDTPTTADADILELIRDVVHQTGQDLSFSTATALPRLAESPEVTSAAND